MKLDDVQKLVGDKIGPTIDKKLVKIHIFEVVCSQGGVRAVNITEKETHK